MRRFVKRVAKAFKRLNQLVLVFPVWLVVGISGFFRNFDQKGWVKSDKETDYRRMF